MQKSILYEIPIDKIDEPNNIRHNYDEGALKDLAKSVQTKGILQPLLLRKGKRGRFNLIAGSRRLRAAKRSNLAAVPGTLVDEMEDKDALILAATENLQREDLNVFEKAGVVLELVQNHGMAIKEVAEVLNKDESFVRRHLKLLSLPEEVQLLIGKNEIPVDAIDVLTHVVSDPQEQVRYAYVARDNKLSGAELREFMKKEQQIDPSKKVGLKIAPDFSHRRYVQDMTPEKIVIRLRQSKRFVENIASTLSSKKPEVIKELFLEVRDLKRSIEKDLKKIEEEHGYLLNLP